MVNTKGAEIPSTGRVVHVVVSGANAAAVHRAALVCRLADQEDLRVDCHVFTLPGDRLPDTGRNLPGPVEVLENVRPMPADMHMPGTWHWPERG